MSRIVVKVGTSTLAHPGGRLNIRHVENLVKVLSDLKNAGHEIILVSSGAIGMGVGKLSLGAKPSDMPSKQAAAAVGQCELMNAYARSFSEYSYRCGQILLTKDGITDKLTRANVTNTIETLLEMRIIPVINENDSVSTTEIMHNGTFGDNDTLSADVAVLANADLLVILSDVDGLYDSNPRENPNAVRISYVDKVTEEMLDFTAGKGSWLGTGGMATKITAMSKVTENGIMGVIADGSSVQTLEKIIDQDDVGTFFAAQ
jgi:glutamate 5-kinase